MITVHKFPVQIQNLFTLKMPAGAEVVHVDLQNRQPFMWVRIDTAQPLKLYEFGVFGTGEDMTDTGNDYPHNNPVAHAPHLGTFLMHDGQLVLHLFGGLYARSI